MTAERAAAERAGKIKMLILDVDGVLTDGRIIFFLKRGRIEVV